MIVFMKNFGFKKAKNILFLFMLLQVQLFAAAPTVTTPILDQSAHNNQFFEMTINTYSTFADTDNDNLDLVVKQSDDSDLPSWLNTQMTASPSLVWEGGVITWPYDIEVSGNYAYIVDGEAGLQVLDISNPAVPKAVGALRFFSLCTRGLDAIKSDARGIAISGNYAYIANGYCGSLAIVNISNPKNPILVSTWGNSIESCSNSVVVLGIYAFVANGNGGLSVINISDPTKPTNTYTVSSTINYARSVDVSGNYVYVADKDGIKIYEIITSPVFSLSYVGSWTTANEIFFVKVVGDYAYFSDGGELKIIDISNPASPSEVGSLSSLGSDFSIVGNYAYFASSTGLEIVDISNPAAPNIVGTLSGDIDGEITVVGNYAYVADYDRGLKVVDITNIANPTLTGRFFSYEPSDVFLKNDYAYVANSENGLQIFDVSNLAKPELIGYFETEGYYSALFVDGSKVYLTSHEGLKIIDVSNPTAPSLLGSSNIITPIYASMVKNGDYLYVNCGTDGLNIINVSNPANPILAGSFAGLSEDSYGIAMLGNYICIPDGSNRLQIIDVSDPANPGLTGSFLSTGGIVFPKVVGNYVYVLEITSGLKVIDISDPTNPVLAGSISACSDCEHVYLFVKGNSAYVFVGNMIEERSEMMVIDISDPTNPKLSHDVFMFFDDDGYGFPFDLTNNFMYSPSMFGLKVINIGEAMQLSGTPTVSDYGILNLKATVSDGVLEVSDEFSINVDDTAPVLSDVPKTGFEDSILTFSLADFKSYFSDEDGDSLVKIEIASLPSNGKLKLSGDPVSLNQEINVDDLMNLSFEPEANWNGDNVFTWKAFDGAKYSDNAANVNINILPMEEDTVPSTGMPGWGGGLIGATIGTAVTGAVSCVITVSSILVMRQCLKRNSASGDVQLKEVTINM